MRAPDAGGNGLALGRLMKMAVAMSGPGLAALTPIAVVPALPAIAKAFANGGDGVFAAQLVMAAPAAMIPIGGAFSAFVSERLGRRNGLLAAFLVYTISGLLGIIAPSLTVLVVTRVILGLATGATMALCMATTGDYFEGDERERVLGYSSATSAIVAVVALAAGGWLVQWAGWRAPLGFYVLGLAAFSLTWAGVEPSVVGARRNSEATPERSLEALLRRLWPAYLLLAMLATGVFMLNVQGPFLLEQDGVTSPGVRGMVLSVYAMTAFSSSLSYGYLRRLVDTKTVLVLAAGAMGAGLAVAAFAHGLVAFVIVGLIVGIGSGVADPAVVSIVLARTPAAARDRATGLCVGAFFIGQLLTPVFTDPLRREFGIRSAFLSHGTLLMLVAGLVALSAYFKTRNRAHA